MALLLQLNFLCSNFCFFPPRGGDMWSSARVVRNGVCSDVCVGGCMHTCHFILGVRFYLAEHSAFTPFRSPIRLSPASINSQAIRSAPLRLIFISLIAWKSGAKHALLISEGGLLAFCFLTLDIKLQHFNRLSLVLLSLCLPCAGTLLSLVCSAPSHPLA